MERVKTLKVLNETETLDDDDDVYMSESENLRKTR